MLPKHFTGLFKREKDKILFFSITFTYNNIENFYVLTEKSGKMGGDYDKKKYIYTDYKEAYDYAVNKVNSLINNHNYILDLGDI
jgi:hypothetical protein